MMDFGPETDRSIFKDKAFCKLIENVYLFISIKKTGTSTMKEVIVPSKYGSSLLVA